MGKLSKNTIQQLFNKYDKNKNGVIEKGELTECFKEIIYLIIFRSPLRIRVVFFLYWLLKRIGISHRK